MLIWREKTRHWSEKIEKWKWIIAMILGAVVMAPAYAQSMHSTTALANGATASSAYSGSSLWFQRDNVPGVGTQRLSAIRMGPNWGIAPAHAFDVGNNFRIGNGSNYFSDPGITANVTSFVTHPLAVPGTFTGTEVDLAVFFWDTALPGTNLTIAPVVLNEVLSYVGYGRPATPGLGLMAPDGQRRLFQTYADAFGAPIAGVSSDYVVGPFHPSGAQFLTLGGCGTSGGSGSGVYNQSGQPVAMLVAGSGSPGYFASTYSLRFDLYSPWIDTIVPTPASATVLAFGGIFAFKRRRK